MSEYKRLTNNNLEDYDPEYDFCIECKYFGEPNGCNRPNGTCDSYDRFMETYNCLTELEDKIENGTIIELPCKVGDTVYKKDGAWTVVGFDCNLVNSWKVKLERWKNKYLDEHETTKVVFSSFGKTVFFTEEEAQLKELQEKQK